MIRTITDSSDKTLKGIEEEMELRGTDELFIMFPLGSQFDHLIMQAMARIGVFCLPANPSSVTAEDITRLKPKGIILSGGPASVHDDTKPKFDEKIFDLGVPTLGICLGFQLFAQYKGCKVAPGDKREFGVHNLDISRLDSPLLKFDQHVNSLHVLQSHGDKITPNGAMQHVAWCENALATGNIQHLWGVQFHPEVPDTVFGDKIFHNFVFRICGATKVFQAGSAAEAVIAETKEQVGHGSKVFLLLSGGSDSSVTAYILKEALGGQRDRLRAMYIRGVDRPEDEAHVVKYFGKQDWLELVIVDGSEDFLRELKGKLTWEDKRLAVRVAYKRITEREAKRFGANFIAQGTLYTDIKESGGGIDSGAVTARIKLHHNVNLGFCLPECMPLANQVKDTARAIGRELGVPEQLLSRHPFPGPGLVVRIEPEITASILAEARQIDGIATEEMHHFGLYHTVWQQGTVILNSISTGTKGDGDNKGYCVAIWGKESVNGFTARASHFTPEFLERVSRRITNEVRGATRVLLDLTDKPPGTIEWG